MIAAAGWGGRAAGGGGVRSTGPVVETAAGEDGRGGAGLAASGLGGVFPAWRGVVAAAGWVAHGF